MGYIELTGDAPKPLRWGMPYSYCKSNGPIVTYVQTLANQMNPEKKLVIPACDGIAHADESEGLVEAPTWRLDFAYPSPTLNELTRLSPDVVGVLCTRNVIDPRYVYLPLDDDTFLHGLRGIPTVEWDAKKPVAFWRGGTSGAPFVRKQLVERARGHPWYDIKFVDHYGSRGVDASDFAPTVGVEEFVKHKYIFAIDGAVISSAHQWVFGSGSVPILITHPLNNFWFKSHLKPWVNYVPVSYSLAELEPTIQWLREHDSEAKQIAMNAMQLANTIFAPSYQREYITRELERVIGQPTHYNSLRGSGVSIQDARQGTQELPATSRE
jgi:hypothetical protein